MRTRRGQDATSWRLGSWELARGRAGSTGQGHSRRRVQEPLWSGVEEAHRPGAAGHGHADPSIGELVPPSISVPGPRFNQEETLVTCWERMCSRAMLAGPCACVK